MSLYFQCCVLHFFFKNSKIEHDPYFWRGEIFFFFLKNWSSLLRYPVGQKFRQNSSISHGEEDASSFVFYSLRKLLMLN